MRQDRNPKPRPAGFRNNLNLRQDLGRPIPPQTQSRYPQSRPPQRAPQPKPKRGPRAMPVAKTPDRWKERRQMLKAAAWRFGKLVHKAPSAVIASENPAEFIRVPDTKARQLAKKIVRLKKTRNLAPKTPPVK